jgi:molecular chaperone DnaK
MLTVTATEKCTGLAKSVTIDTAGQHRLNLDAARTNLAALFEEQDAAAAEARGDDPRFGGDDDGFIDLEDEDEDDSENEDDEREPAATGPAAPGEGAKLLASAKSLRHRAEKLLATGLPDADAAAIRETLAAVSPAIETRDWAVLRQQLDALSDLLFYLED